MMKMKISFKTFINSISKMSTPSNRMTSKINKWMISKLKKVLVSEAARTWSRKFFTSKTTRTINLQNNNKKSKSKTLESTLIIL
jgi:hypothetical protein